MPFPVSFRPRGAGFFLCLFSRALSFYSRIGSNQNAVPRLFSVLWCCRSNAIIIVGLLLLCHSSCNELSMGVHQKQSQGMIPCRRQMDIVVAGWSWPFRGRFKDVDDCQAL